MRQGSKPISEFHNLNSSVACQNFKQQFNYRSKKGNSNSHIYSYVSGGGGGGCNDRASPLYESGEQGSSIVLADTGEIMADRVGSKSEYLYFKVGLSGVSPYPSHWNVPFVRRDVPVTYFYMTPMDYCRHMARWFPDGRTEEEMFRDLEASGATKRWTAEYKARVAKINSKASAAITSSNTMTALYSATVVH